VEVSYPSDSVGYQEYLMTVTDANNCEAELLWRVVVFPPCDEKNVNIPNAFTPNNDGTNDYFKPLASEGGELFGKITIFDRWGEKVYESRTEISWDGTAKGKPAASDVYVYIIEIQCGNLIVPKSGEITLLR
jgi:gliding motility-associated-like protein